MSDVTHKYLTIEVALSGDVDQDEAIGALTAHLETGPTMAEHGCEFVGFVPQPAS